LDANGKSPRLICRDNNCTSLPSENASIFAFQDRSFLEKEPFASIDYSLERSSASDLKSIPAAFWFVRFYFFKSFEEW
jgi:hypothetical protein